ncbi:hypothetical protein LCGC14_1732510 [marine sediment metagenome]|uniref:Uncharacterized protein n=1 Tax=marine sediment metagenome TaxID=412755 RepID=A0A0F9H943_9ZZZZ
MARDKAKGVIPTGPGFAETVFAPFAKAVTAKGMYDYQLQNTRQNTALAEQEKNKRAQFMYAMQAGILGTPGSQPMEDQQYMDFGNQLYPYQQKAQGWSNINAMLGAMQKKKKLAGMDAWGDADFKREAISYAKSFISNSPAGMDLITGENPADNIAKLIGQFEGALRQAANREASAGEVSTVEDIYSKYKDLE